MPVITAQSQHSGCGGRRIATQSRLWLRSAFEAILGYVRPCCKVREKRVVGVEEEGGERGKEEWLGSGSVDKSLSLRT